MFLSSCASLTILCMLFAFAAFVSAFSISSSSSSPLTPLDQNEKEEAAANIQPLDLGGGVDLLLVQVLLRHGDRTPISIEPASRYTNDDFPEGLGELTNRGKERIFAYGRVLAKRYRQYFKSFYVRNIIAQSSPLRRCLETHEALLAGMFLPRRTNIWNKNPNDEIGSKIAKMWNPIGISTVEKNRSWKTNPDAPCPVADDIVHKFNETCPSLKKFFEETKDFRAKVEEFSGQFIYTWQFYGYLYDNIFSEREKFGKNFKWPGWLEKVTGDADKTLAKLKEFNDKNFAIFSEAPEKLFKLRTGALLAEMVENMKTAAKSIGIPKRSNRKLYSYTSHDVMVAYVMHMFGAFKKQPSYGSGLLLELRRDFHTQEPMVHLFYANVTNNNEIYPLKLNEMKRFSEHCTDSSGACSLENFANSLKGIIDVNPEEDCKKTSE